MDFGPGTSGAIIGSALPRLRGGDLAPGLHLSAATPIGKELFLPIVSQISDMLNCEIGSEAFRRWVGRVVALHDENDGEAIPHDLLGSMQDVWVIVDHHIVIGGLGPRDLIQVLLLMREDYDAPLNYLYKAGPDDFLRLEDLISVRDNDG